MLGSTQSAHNKVMIPTFRLCFKNPNGCRLCKHKNQHGVYSVDSKSVQILTDSHGLGKLTSELPPFICVCVRSNDAV